MKNLKLSYRIKALLIISLVAILSNRPASAGNDEYSQWLQQQTQSFQEYKDARDKAFTQFLKSHWTAVELLKGKQPDQVPKPVTMPVAKIIEPAPPGKNKPAPLVLMPLPDTKTIEPTIPAPMEKVRKFGQKISVDYFGQKIPFYYDRELRVALGNHLSLINKNVISDYWSQLSKTRYESLLKQLNAHKKALKLTDWAYAALVHKLGIRIAQSSRNAGVLTSWFLLAKTGYQAKVAYNSSRVYLLMPSKQEMFEVPYFTLSNKRYYVVNFDGSSESLGQVFTYAGDYPDTTHKLDMKVTKRVAASDAMQNRHLSFKFEGKQYNIEASYDRGRIDFFRSYPQLALPMYFSAGVDPAAASPLLKQLKIDMQDMSETQAVNFLLRFVQVSLKYETDEQQFGKENYLFPEETLYYPYSDCEDRAILFSWLVKSLLGLDVIGLDYPGHIAAAVHFSFDVKGDNVVYQGKKYTVTDPTYINANAGMTMPKYKNTKPTLIIY